MTPTSRAEAGLTILELLVVITLITTLAAAAGGVLGRSSAGGAMAARDAARFLETARIAALRSGADVAVRVADGALRGPAAALSPPEGVAFGLDGDLVFFAEGGAAGGPLRVTDDRGARLVAVRRLTGGVVHDAR